MYRVLLFILINVLFIHAQAASVHEYTLDNGLKALVKEDHRAPIVISQIWYKVGSADEIEGKTGLSHVLEHMMFKGTTKHPAGEFSKIIAANGGQENAFTSRDFTGYYQRLKSDRLKVSFELEADRMRHLLLSDDEFKREIEVIKEERRMRVDDNPQALTYERFNATAFKSGPYHHMTIGWMNDLKKMKVEDLRAWYKKWYAPNNAVLVVVGDVRAKAVYELAKQYFGDIPQTTSIERNTYMEPETFNSREVALSAPAKLPTLFMGFNVPSLKTADKRWQAYALDVLAGILDGGKSARLEKKLIRDKQIATQIGVGYDLYSRYSGLFSFQGIPSKKHTVHELQKAIMAEVNLLKSQLVSMKELSRVKAQVIADKFYARDSIYGQAMLLGRLESVDLSWRDGEHYVERLRAITPQQVRQIARMYLKPERMTVGILKPKKL